MMSKTDSTTDDDCRFESPWLATALTRSFFVRSHLPWGRDAVSPRAPGGHCPPRAMKGVYPFCSSSRRVDVAVVLSSNGPIRTRYKVPSLVAADPLDVAGAGADPPAARRT